MPFVKVPDGEIHYEVFGKGFPVMTFAHGGPRSTIEAWRQGGPEKADPIKALSGDFMVIAMDQRQAGQSRTSVKPTDGWHTFVADAIAVMDAAGVKKAHMLGCCIGPSYALGVGQAAPERVVSQVAWNPMGRSETNHERRLQYVAEWIADVCKERPDLDEATLLKVRDNMYGDKDFIYSVGRDFVRQCPVPMLVMPGSDGPHPTAIGEEIGSLAPKVEWFRDWKHKIPEQERVMRDFLKAHTPAA